MIIGDYQIQMFNDGRWCIEFYQKNISSYVTLWVHDLPRVFDDLVARALQPRQECARLFRWAFSNVESFVEDEFNRMVVSAILCGDPPWIADARYPKTPENTLDWHLFAFVQGFNAVNGSNVRPDEVLPYVVDMKHDFI